jgi:hypothetical protein
LKSGDKSNDGICELCQRECQLTFHHLIPKKVHKRNFFRKKYRKDDLQQGIHICRKCHSGIHNLYDEKHLAKELNTLEKLLADEAIQKHVKWVAKQ